MRDLQHFEELHETALALAELTRRILRQHPEAQPALLTRRLLTEAVYAQHVAMLDVFEAAIDAIDDMQRTAVRLGESASALESLAKKLSSRPARKRRARRT